MNVLIAVMRAVLISMGITPPTPENERKIVLLLFLMLLGLALGIWLMFRFLTPILG